MDLDIFTELGAERFRGLEPGYHKRSGLFFQYMNHSPEFTPRSAGLWPSKELVKKQIEAAHHISDIDCVRALRSTRTYLGNAAVWLGLLIEVSPVSDVSVTIPQFLLRDYGYLAMDPKTPLKTELEERYGVQIKTQ